MAQLAAPFVFNAAEECVAAQESANTDSEDKKKP